MFSLVARTIKKIKFWEEVKDLVNKDDIVKKAALGATGVAITAGAIVAGVALVNKKNRIKVRKIADKIFKGIAKVGEAIQDGADRYQVYQHRIGMGKGKAKGLMKKSAHGRRKNRKNTD